METVVDHIGQAEQKSRISRAAQQVIDALVKQFTEDEKKMLDNILDMVKFTNKTMAPSNTKAVEVGKLFLDQVVENLPRAELAEAEIVEYLDILLDYKEREWYNEKLDVSAAELYASNAMVKLIDAGIAKSEVGTTFQGRLNLRIFKRMQKYPVVLVKFFIKNLDEKERADMQSSFEMLKFSYICHIKSAEREFMDAVQKELDKHLA